MVSVVWSLIMVCLGLLVYFATPILAPALPVDLQRRVARYHSDLAMRAYQQVALVRRKLGTFELYPLSVNDEEKLAQVTLDSGIVSDSEKLEFADPDNRMLRLHRKPFALVYEGIPAIIDAELAELGYWTRERDTERGLYREPEEKVDPFLPMSDSLRVVDPGHLAHLAGKAIEPENIKTARQLTKERFSKYGQKVGMAETIGVITGFAVGAGGVAAMQYVKTNLLDGGGKTDPGSTIPISTVAPPDGLLMHAVDVLVVVA